MVIGLTGASGNMGREALKSFMEIEFVDKVRVLLLQEKREKKLAKAWKKLYKDRIEFVWGTLNSDENCKKLVEGTEYVFHLAAVIPPMADHYFDKANECNNLGTKKLVKAIENANPQPKFIHISTVALYGNRNEKHPWGRVGDPLLPSVYDVYSITKYQGERAVLESKIKTFSVLRQSGMLHKNLLRDNIADGLLFHTCYNVPIEWSTAHDSGVLLKNIVLRDHNNEVPEFWHRIYNIGCGHESRVTGYETFQEGFGIIGVTTEKFMKPNWNATRNFHCVWYLDSQILEDMFHFQSESIHSFWQNVLNEHKYFKLAKIVPASWLSAMVVKPLLKDSNAPWKWATSGDEGRTIAAFGSKKAFDELPKTWDKFDVFCKHPDYQDKRDINKVTKADYLDHGYDENKPLSELDIEDMRKAAEFRGGKLISENMVKGDIYTPLLWENSEGDRFELSPFSVLIGGHWDNIDKIASEWNWDLLAKKNKFYAQQWYDSHDKDEDNVYYFKDGKACYHKINK